MPDGYNHLFNQIEVMVFFSGRSNEGIFHLFFFWQLFSRVNAWLSSRFRMSFVSEQDYVGMDPCPHSAG